MKFWIFSNKSTDSSLLEKTSLKLILKTLNSRITKNLSSNDPSYHLVTITWEKITSRDNKTNKPRTPSRDPPIISESSGLLSI